MPDVQLSQAVRAEPALAGLRNHLTRCGVTGDVLLALAGEPVGAQRPVLLIGPHLDEQQWTAAGLTPGPLTHGHEIRVRPGRDAGELAARSDELLLRDRFPLCEPAADGVEVLLTANVAFHDHPVATWRPATGVAVLTVGSSPSTYADPGWQRMVARLLRRVLGLADRPPVRVGMLGYGAIGAEHAQAITATVGLELGAVCDSDRRRVAAARQVAPGLPAYDSADALLADDSLDLVVVSTPPDTHSAWAVKALEAGRSVVVEKPFCLTVAEADRQIAVAAERGLTLAVYQNRRWDADYLALRDVVRTGRIGEVFHVETFVGGYGHPCNFWHSDVAISGGAIYDWGSHYLDWLLDLLPQPVQWVSATAHKRVWHDVTNADHSRVLLHFADGVEAEFTHSDLAAALKPKFYVLGTTGAVVGHWRSERVVSRTAIGTLAEDRLAPADSPAELHLHAADGSRTLLAVPAPPVHPFHRELADQLLWGAPMSVTPAGSRRTISVMQAATASAADAGCPVAPSA